MFNDIGVIGVSRPLPDGSVEPGFRVFFAGGLGANPHPALALEEFTSREDLMPTIEAALRVWSNHGNRDNKLRARMKWLVDTMGIDELRTRIVKERKFLIGSATWPGGIPAAVEELGDAPAGMGTAVAADLGSPIEFSGLVAVRQVGARQRRARSRANGTVSAYAHCRLGDITPDQFRGLADVQRDLDVEIRITNRQNFVLRGLTEDQLAPLFERLTALDMAAAGAELARDVVACPGADTCNLAVTQSRGLASDIDQALEDAGLAEVGGVRINISGCTNSCGQHHISDIGFFGLERRAHGQAAPGLPDAARRPRRRHGDRVRPEGHEAARQGRVRRPSCAWWASSPPTARPASRSAAGSTATAAPRRSGRRSRTSTSSPTRPSTRSSTSTSARPGPYVAEVGDSECAT